MVQLYSRVSRSLALPISTMPRFIIPLADKLDSSIGGMTATFTRNSIATYIDANGILQTAGIDVIRFHNGRYLCEPTATNLISYSGVMTNENWGKIGTTCVQQSIAGKTWYKVSAISTGTLVILYSNQVDTALGSYYTQSLEAKAGNTNFISLTFSSGINSLLGYAVFDLVNGTIDTIVNCAATILKITDGEYRCSITLAATATAKLPAVIVTPSRSGASRAAAIGGDYVYINKAQCETGTKATSYIPTTTDPMDRVADSLHYAVGDVITQGQGSLYCEFIDGNSIATYGKRVVVLSDGTSNNKIALLLSTAGKLFCIVTTSGTNVVYTGETVISSYLNKLLVTYQDNNTKIYLNGINIFSDTVCIIPSNLTKLTVGMNETNTYQLNSEIGNVKYFKEVLTPEEAIKLTTL